MKKILLMAVAAMMATISALAQQIQVKNSDGNAVPFASVLTTNAEYIGVTDLDGILSDVKGASEIIVSHVAFKTQQTKVQKTGTQVITLEDADFGLDEITVSPKPLVYVQTYYRMYMYNEKDGIGYYRVGITDNTYDRSKKKVSASTNHVAKAKYGIIKTVLGMFGSFFDKYSEIKAGTFEDRMVEWGKDVKIKFTDEGPGKKRISDFKGTVGYVTDDVSDHLRRFSYNSTLIYLHRLEAKRNSKKLKKKEKREAKKKNKNETDFQLYQIDDNGNYAPEDFIMKENIESWDEEDENDGKSYHNIFCIQVFSTDRAYVTKEELKQRKKANKIKMSYANIQQFERDNGIPAVAPVVQQKLSNLWKTDQ